MTAIDRGATPGGYTGDSGSVRRAVRRALYAWTVRPGWIAVGIVAAWYTLGFQVPRSVRLGALLVGVGLLGVPHGGVDHLAVPRVRGERPTARWLRLVGLLYLGLGSAYTVLWFLAPVVAALAFVALTWLHWGQGDLWPLLVIVPGAYLRGRLRRAVVLALRGGLPMLVPRWSFPERYRAVLGAIVRRFGASPSALNPLFLPSTRLAIVTALAGLTVLVLATGLAVAPDRRGWASEAGETGLLWWLFAVVPPVTAIGVYFVTWHSLRHVGRLLAVDPVASEALAEGRPRRAAWRFARDAAPLSTLSLFGLLGLVLAVPSPPSDVVSWISLALVFIAVLTLPHVVVVTIMDFQQDVWQGQGWR